MNLILPSPPGQSPPLRPDQPKLWRAGTLTYTTAGLAALFGWLLWGDFAWSMKERAGIPIAQLMLHRFQASDFLNGLLVGSLPAAMGMILGPVVSVRSDRHRGRWGRRIPFLLVPAPLGALSMVGLAFVPTIGRSLQALLGAHSPNLFTLDLLIFAFFWSMFEVTTVIANSIFGGLINDVVPAEVLGRFFGVFRAVGLMAGILFSFRLMGQVEEHFTVIFLGMGALYGLGFITMCLKVKEGDYPPPPPLAPADSVQSAGAVRTYLKECFTNPYYLWLFLGMTFAMLASGPVNSFSIFYAKSLGMGMDEYGKYLALTYVISLVLSYGLGVLADRFHPLRVGIVATGLYAAAMLWGAVFATTPRTYAFALVLHGVLSGVFLTSTASLGQRLFPRTRFAQFASANGIFGAVGFLLMPALVGAMLDWSHHVYRYTFVAGGVLAVAGLAALLVVHGMFMKLGGPRAYVAPEQ